MISQQQLLERIQKGGNLSKLKLKIIDSNGPSIVKLSELRRGRGFERVVIIIIAPLTLLQSSVQSALTQGRNLQANELMIVPIQIVKPADAVDGSYEIASPSFDAIYEEKSLTSQPEYIATAFAVASWKEVLKNEISVALKQQPDALEMGVTIIIKKNGKVGTRKFGVQIWDTLVDSL